MKRLVLWRHGRTEWNSTRQAQGHHDLPLDEIGRSQISAAAPTLAKLDPAIIWSSDLARARGSAEILAKLTGSEVTVDPRLREYDVGERTGITTAQFAERYPDHYAAWLADDESLVVPGAETTAQLLARWEPALRDALAAVPDGGVGVVVVHGSAVKAAIASILGLPVAATRHALAGMANAHWAVIEESDDGVKLIGYNLTHA